MMSRLLAWCIKYIGPFLAGAGAIIAAIFALKRTVRKAERKGERQERERIDRAARERGTEIKEEAREIDDAHRDLSDDDLRRRMRESAVKRDR